MKKLVMILTAAAISLSAGSFYIKDEVKVIRSIPEYKTVTKRIPYEECWEEEVPTQGRYSNSSGDNDVIGSLIGGAAGGIIGNQIGGGSGKTVATVGGAIIGTLVGNKISRQNRNYDNYSQSYETRKRCSTRYHSQEEERFVGYKNIARYKGKEIIKFSQNKLHYIPINISVSY